MDIYYKNETLYVDVTNDITLDTMNVLERRLFRILDDYGIDKIVICILGHTNKELLTRFKRLYYQNYKGYLLIK